MSYLLRAPHHPTREYIAGWSAAARDSRKEKDRQQEFESNQMMPVKYKIDKANRIIRTRCIGQVTIEEVVDHFRLLERDPDCPDRVDVLLDLSKQTSIPEKANLQRVAEEIRRIRGRVQFGLCAIVACTDALFGMIRMLEVFAEQYFRESFVFRTADEAEVWLASQPTTSAAGQAQK
jgi:hypothetical protein